MAKTRRLISENLKHVHIFIEVLDARVPVSSRNPELRRLTGDKPTILLLNKASLADPAASQSFVRQYTDRHTVCLLCDCVTGEGLNRLPGAIRTVLSEEGTFAVVPKDGNGGPIGAIGVFPTEIPEGRGEPELGYGGGGSQHRKIHPHQPYERCLPAQGREPPRRDPG